MGRSRYHFIQGNSPYFITCTVLHWIPIFTRRATVEIILESMRFLSKEGMILYAYVILENHMHFLAGGENLQHNVARFKSYTARHLIRYLVKNKVKMILDQLAFYKKAHKADRVYQFWQEGVHPELVQNENMMNQKVDYIHFNPVKRGYVDKPEHWRYSSARNYLGATGLIEVCTEW